MLIAVKSLFFHLGSWPVVLSQGIIIFFYLYRRSFVSLRRSLVGTDVSDGWSDRRKRNRRTRPLPPVTPCQRDERERPQSTKEKPKGRSLPSFLVAGHFLVSRFLPFFLRSPATLSLARSSFLRCTSGRSVPRSGVTSEAPRDASLLPSARAVECTYQMSRKDPKDKGSHKIER